MNSFIYMKVFGDPNPKFLILLTPTHMVAAKWAYSHEMQGQKDKCRSSSFLFTNTL